MSLTLFLSLCLLAFSAVAVRLHGRDLNAQLSSSYDYVVCGCGVSGLVVANRLSEDPGVSVLCIEAGNADNYEEFIQVPQFVGSGILSQYDWRFATLPQIYLDGAQRLYPQGKGLGGGSLINAMCWNRGGADDYNAWEALGNPGWNWDSLLPYFIKSENYTPVFSEQIAQDLSINFNPAVHGSDGYVHVSYPKYFYSQSRNLFSGMEQLGVPIVFDPNDGTNAGASFIPTALDPDNQTRSDARRTYFDPFINRPNFHVVTGQQCTRAIFEGVVGNTAGSVPMTGGNPDGEGPGDTVAPSIGLFIGNSSAPPPTEGAANAGSRFMPRQAASGYRATGVEFAADAASPRQTVLASREVIFAAGALHSAQLLQLSGVGPPDLLARNNIPVAVSLPGVGNNLQDHYLVGTFYPYNNVTDSPAELSTNETYNAEARAQYYANKTGPWTAGSPNGVAFPSLPDTSNVTFDLLNSASIQPPEEYLVDGLDPSLVAGYAAQKSVLVELLNQRNIGAWEIINNNIGSLTVAVMHPFSRGTCSINSPNPFDPPVIDPRYGSNPTDLQILVEALLFNRRILATPPMVELQPAQFVPPVDADMDAIMQVIKNGIRTEFHPSGTCAMLPRELGGVVDPNLRVYGTQNLRVVDAGIMPLIPAAHLQAPVYAVAERVRPDTQPLEPTLTNSLGRRYHQSR
ncbi:MAG: hypothetical protein M1833_003370 [Piccolia ochrophora]|nr:MAG: hypothetical protein M1833_003370 [Piccolia ochrophora]